MSGTQPNTLYIGSNTSEDGTAARLLPFKPSPDRTTNGRKLFKALYNDTLNKSEQIGTPYQFSFIVSVFNSIALTTLYNNTNANLTYDVTLNNDGTISFSVTDVNGTSTITTTQALEVGWSYELTFQYTYNGEFIPLTYFLRSDFMRVFINGRLANTAIDLDGDASIAPALAASTLVVTSTANTFMTFISQWYSAWWVSSSYSFAWSWWYNYWYAWWGSSWWSYWYSWWLWYVWWDCVLTGCDPANCGPNSCHPEAPFDQMYQFERYIGDVDFVLAGVGIRDFNTNTTPAAINVTVPGTVIKAYLYWNTIGGGQAEAACPNTAIFNGDSGTGDIIGCCGNTCWAAECVNDGMPNSEDVPDQNLLNKVWFRDVTDLVPGSGSYTISIPNVIPGSFIAYGSSDSPYYPGCQGGQGIALLVIYQTDPQVITRPRQHCCVPVDGQTVTETLSNELIIWHGAKLLKCENCPPPPTTVGGSTEYTISWRTKYTWNPKIATAVGDAQSTFNDSLFWNDTALPPSPSYFNPYVGNLMHVKTEHLPAHTARCDCGGLSQENSVRVTVEDDCLCWMLLVWFGQQKCVTPIVTSSSAFAVQNEPQLMAFSNPNAKMMMALSECTVKVPSCGSVCLPTRLNVKITAKDCPCLAAQGYTMEWDNSEQKYLLQATVGICGCSLFGWLYCVGTQWVLYLALSEGSIICSDGINVAFPINCKPFGGVGSLAFTAVDPCSCACVNDVLQVDISPG